MEAPSTPPPNTPTDSTTIDGPPHLLRMASPRDAIQLSDDPNSVLDPPCEEIDLPTARRLF